MKKQVICIIAEGSYPYVVGGVSSWINQLIKGHPEKDFKILSILPSKNSDFEIRYQLPENLLEVKTVYLTDVDEYKINKKTFMKYDDEENKLILDFIDMKLTDDTPKALNLMSDKNKNSVFHFTTSKFFWNQICVKYNKEYSNKEFNNFYWSYKAVFTFLINILQNEIPDADLYHSVSTGYAGVIGILAKTKYNKPFYLTEHGIYAREREEDILKSGWVSPDFKKIWIDYFYYLSKIAYKFADKVITLFDYSSQLEIALGAPKERTLVIPNGVDIERLSKIEKEETGKFIVGSVLRIVPIKDVKMMIKAFKIATNKIKEIELYLIGPYEEDPDYYEECKILIEDLELTEKINFTGKVDIKDYLGKIDIFLLSSISEGQPLSILEAMSAKVPIIATDVGDSKNILIGYPEIGSAGIIVPPTSYVKLALEIENLYNDRERLKKMGECGYKIVKKYYKADDFLEKYRKLYNERWD